MVDSTALLSVGLSLVKVLLSLCWLEGKGSMCGCLVGASRIRSLVCTGLGQSLPSVGCLRVSLSLGLWTLVMDSPCCCCCNRVLGRRGAWRVVRPGGSFLGVPV